MTVDPELCVGTAECVRLAPQAFEIDEHRGVSVPQAGAATTDLDILKEAASNCPTRAIRVDGEAQ
ncbi:MAG: ferredoxin [Candidatus Limnocylindria bacterium]